MPPFARHNDGRPNWERETSPKLEACGRPGLSPVTVACSSSRRRCQISGKAKHRSGDSQASGAALLGKRQAAVSVGMHVRLCCLPGTGFHGRLPISRHRLQDRTAPGGEAGSRTRFPALKTSKNDTVFPGGDQRGKSSGGAAHPRHGELASAGDQHAGSAFEPAVLQLQARNRLRSNGPGMTRCCAFTAKKPKRS